ncbi:hypothetical protein AB0F52_48505 [Amycolatopsis sp. NPDC024027]|uniref:hypothetical protein n=1 Tax=Amycolatopsis sp. NPDC024027 TaxID=3154327 RepID=UPI003408AC62
MKNQLGALSLFVGLVGIVISYLSLAHDSQAWPYTGPAWIWIVLGAAVAAGEFCWILVRRIRNAPLSLWALSAGFTMAVIGTVVGTTAAASTAAVQITADASAGAIASAVSIDSLSDDQLIDDPITVGGPVDHPLASGESMWLFVGNIPPTGGQPSTYYLLPGPCEIRDGGRSWARSNVALAHIGRRKIDFTCSAPSAINRASSGSN